MVRFASLLLAVSAGLLCAVLGQPGNTRPETATTLAPGITASTRFSERLEVPGQHPGSKVAFRTELGAWQLQGRTREIPIPPQGFYIAELRNGHATTVVNGKETDRSAGDLWAVQAGETMIVKIIDPKQQNVLLHIFSVRPVD